MSIHFSQEHDLDLSQEITVDAQAVRERELVLYNDDYNTFEFVIECLIDICNHDPLQAEQCTHIVHYNGKCVVKTGAYAKLNPMRVALCDRGLSAVIK